MMSRKGKLIKIAITALLPAITGFGPCATAEVVQVERRLTADTPVFIEEEVLEEKPEYKEKIYMHSFYEYNFVKQRGKGHGEWQVMTNRLAYLNDGVPMPYVDFSYYKRFADENLTMDIGSYFKFDNGFVHAKGGYGKFKDTNFMYNWKGRLEAEHKLFRTVYINIDGTYLSKTPDDVYVFTPGLVYYFGDHYISADYGLSLIVTRGVGQFGTVRGNFVITEHVDFYGGGAIGEWLYDIFELPADKEKGYLFFTGVNVHITDNVMLKIAVSWAHEEPQFEKTGINSGMSIKF